MVGLGHDESVLVLGARHLLHPLHHLQGGVIICDLPETAVGLSLGALGERGRGRTHSDGEMIIFSECGVRR